MFTLSVVVREPAVKPQAKILRVVILHISYSLVQSFPVKTVSFVVTSGPQLAALVCGFQRESAGLLVVSHNRAYWQMAMLNNQVNMIGLDG